jgi:hypothetical protein
MSDVEKPRFTLRLMLSSIGPEVEVKDPTLITDEMVGEAWNMINAFIMDILDSLELEVDDEHFREIFIHLCYKLIYREMTTLLLMPFQEENFKERLGTRKRGPRKRKGDA